MLNGTIRTAIFSPCHRPLVLTSLLSGLLTISLFLYILLIPVLKGIPPNVRLSCLSNHLFVYVALSLFIFLSPFGLCGAYRHTVSSTGHGENLENSRPSFPYVIIVVFPSHSNSSLLCIYTSYPLRDVQQILTASMIIGWSFLSYTLGRYSPLGYIEGVIGCQSLSPIALSLILIHWAPLASGLYALAVGLMGLLPAPRIKRS